MAQAPRRRRAPRPTQPLVAFVVQVSHAGTALVLAGLGSDAPRIGKLAADRVVAR